MKKHSLLGLLKGEDAKSWEVQLQLWVNKLCLRLGCKGLFDVDKKHCTREPTKCQRRFETCYSWIRWPFAQAYEAGVFDAKWLLIVGMCIWAIWTFGVVGWDKSPDSSDYLTEFAGLLFDIVFILMIFRVFVFQKENGQDVARQQEIIDDFKYCDSEESKHRIAGAVRRLNLLGRTDIDLSFAQISELNWKQLGVDSLQGANLYGQTTWIPSATETYLKRVRFDDINCSDVTFCDSERWKHRGKFTLESFAPDGKVNFEDCSFRNVRLERANFRGANLVWIDEPPEFLDEEVEDDNGQTFWIPKHSPPFEGSDLSGVVFDGAQFKNADFRKCYGLETASFKGCTGLEDALFDCQDEQDRALAQAKDEGR